MDAAAKVANVFSGDFNFKSEFMMAPSLLSCDFARLETEINCVEDAGADLLHVDVMDGHFVPNLTLGAPIVESIFPVSRRPLDVHLMIEKPDQYIPDFAKAGASILTVHIETMKNALKTFDLIRSFGVKVGLTLRPRTDLRQIIPFLKEVDLVLVMTVEPGFGGQSFMPDQVGKISELAKLRERHGYKFLIEVDGGINEQTYTQVKDADILVAGSYVFKKPAGNRPNEKHNPELLRTLYHERMSKIRNK